MYKYLVKYKYARQLKNMCALFQKHTWTVHVLIKFVRTHRCVRQSKTCVHYSKNICARYAFSSNSLEYMCLSSKNIYARRNNEHLLPFCDICENTVTNNNISKSTYLSLLNYYMIDYAFSIWTLDILTIIFSSTVTYKLL